MQVKSGLDSPLRLSCQPCHHVWDAVVHMETFDRQGLIGDLVPFRPHIKYCCQGLKSNSCRVWEISNTGAFEPASKEKSGRLGKGIFKVFELLRSVFRRCNTCLLDVAEKRWDMWLRDIGLISWCADTREPWSNWSSYCDINIYKKLQELLWHLY